MDAYFINRRYCNEQKKASCEVLEEWEVWYFKIPEMKCFKSTGETSKAMAMRYAERVIAEKRAGKENPLFRDYAEPYFDWDRCPHATRLIAEGKNISERYCRNNRRLLEKYVFNSPLGRMHIFDSELNLK